MVRDLLQDLLHGLRGLRRRPGFTVLVVVSLALGIAANTVIFSIVNAVLLRPLPVREPGRLVLLTDPYGGGRVDGPPPRVLELAAHPLYRRLRAESRALEGLAAQDSEAQAAHLQKGGAGERADDPTVPRAVVRPVSANYFALLGVGVTLGRTFLPDDQRVLVLGHGVWQARFGGDPAIVGARLLVDGHPYTVIGVAAAGFTGLEVGRVTEVWIPLAVHADLNGDRSLLDDRGERWLQLVGRLGRGVPAETAAAELNVIYRQFLAEEPPKEREREARAAARIELVPGGGGASSLQKSFRGPLLALMTGAALLLLIVCLNVSHLVLARALERQREIGIRSALGASRGRLVRQLLAEGALLSGLGLLAAGLAIPWLRGLLLALAPGASSLDVRADGRVVAFTAVVVAAMALVLGTVPAWSTEIRRVTSRAVTAGRSQRRLGKLLLVSQVAFSLVLLVGAGLFAGTLRALRNVDKGFDEEHVLLVRLERGRGVESTPALQAQLLARVEALPGVRSASLSDLPGFLGGGRITEVISVAGRDAPTTNPTIVQLIQVSAGYFETVGMPLARGRAIGPDDCPGGPRVAVVNETLARHYFGGVDGAVGRRFSFDPVFSPSRPGQQVEVVGVVRDARINNLRDPPPAVAYLSLDKPTRSLDSMQVRAAGDPAPLRLLLPQVVRDAHPGLEAPSVATLRGRVERSLWQQSLLASLSTSFGLAALFLVCVGLYGVVAQWASQRTREIGVRVALGATPGGVKWLVLRQALLLLAAGLALGVPAALAAAHLTETLVYRMAPAGPLAAAALALLAAVTLAAWFPARRAARLSPMAALRSE